MREVDLDTLLELDKAVKRTLFVNNYRSLREIESRGVFYFADDGAILYTNDKEQIKDLMDKRLKDLIFISEVHMLQELKKYDKQLDTFTKVRGGENYRMLSKTSCSFLYNCVEQI